MLTRRWDPLLRFAHQSADLAAEFYGGVPYGLPLNLRPPDHVFVCKLNCGEQLPLFPGPTGSSVYVFVGPDEDDTPYFPKLVYCVPERTADSVGLPVIVIDGWVERMVGEADRDDASVFGLFLGGSVFHDDDLYEEVVVEDGVAELVSPDFSELSVIANIPDSLDDDSNSIDWSWGLANKPTTPVTYSLPSEDLGGGFLIEQLYRTTVRVYLDREGRTIVTRASV